MRSSKSRSRNKANRPRTLGNIVNRVFDSSGPEGKVRGTPQQIIEKYLFLARDAQLSNDRVAAENFMQHAEHYTRMLAEATREMAAEQEERQRQYGNGGQNGNGQNGNGQTGGQNGNGQNGSQNGNGWQADGSDRPQGNEPRPDQRGDQRPDQRGDRPQQDRDREQRADRPQQDQRGDRPQYRDRPNDRANDRRDDRPNDRQGSDRQNDRPANDRPANDRAANDRQGDRPNDRTNDRPNDRRDDRGNDRRDDRGPVRTPAAMEVVDAATDGGLYTPDDTGRSDLAPDFTPEPARDEPCRQKPRSAAPREDLPAFLNAPLDPAPPQAEPEKKPRVRAPRKPKAESPETAS